MRPIKYRAWVSKECKRYNKARMWDWEEVKEELITDGHFFKMFWDENYPHIIPLQYTGLLDKNGVEIYEGDVVKRIIEDKAIVVFCDGDFQLTKDRFFGTAAGEQFPVGTMDNMEARNCKVIGNIYENPKLLK